MALINHLVIIGVGSIGASLGLALKNASVVNRITGVGRSEANLKEALAMGAIDDYALTPAEVVPMADVVFLAVPMCTMGPVIESLKGVLSADTIVTDGGSSKSSVIQLFKNTFGDTRQFVPGHPIAGTEKSGAKAAIVDLYQNRRVILTPTQDTPSESLAIVRRMWESTGAQIEEMDAPHHDKVLAFTSHLPHMLAFGLVDSLSNNKDVQEIFRYAAGGFRDFTRIASSDPVMWRDICLSNKDALLEAMDVYLRDINALYLAVKQSDADTLLDMFSNAKKTRDAFMG